MRWTGYILLVGSIAASACHGPPLKEGGPDGGSAGRGGSGTTGTGGAVTGTAGTGTAGGTAGTGTAGTGTAGTGTAGTGTAGTGTAGTGTAGSAGVGGRAGGGGRGGSGGAAGTSANACLRCETPCRDGLCELAVVHTSQTNVYSSATSTVLNDGRLYFVVGTGVRVLSIAAGGGPETELVPYRDCSGCRLTLAVDGADVFFASMNAGNQHSILAVPKGGGGGVRTVCVTTSAVPSAVTLEGNYVYYVRADKGIERCLKAGGGTTMNAVTVGSATSPNVVIRMSSRPGYLLWGDRDKGVVTRLDTNQLTTQVLGVTMNATANYPYGVCDVVDDGTRAYWVLCAWPYNLYAEGGPNMPMERGSALGGGDPNAIFDEYGSVGLDGDYVYFTEAGLLNRVPKAGGPVEARARMVDASTFVIKAVIVGFDDRYVYLARAAQGDGAIYRVIK